MKQALEYIKSKLGDKKPDIGIILGSGLGKVVDILQDPIVIKYADITGMPLPTVKGHKGCLYIGKLGKHMVLCLQGRIHLYEGHPPQLIYSFIEFLKDIGLKELIITKLYVCSANRHKARIFSVKSYVVARFGLVDGDDEQWNVEVEAHQHIGYLLGILPAHCLVVVDYDSVCGQVLGDVLTKCLPDVLDYAFKVVILIAIEILEDSIVIEAECATDITLADFL